MRFLADENFPGVEVLALRESGHDVVWVRTDAPGLGDDRILEWATRDDRIILTFDKDFGELAYRAAMPAVCGIVLFRLPMSPPGSLNRRLADRINERSDWAGHFSVIESNKTRMRRLP
jgi:predicted nuclease of predicted toxin-antitoxin system